MTVPQTLTHNALLPMEFPAVWASDWGEDTYGLWISFCYRGVRQQLRWIMPGEFLMGSPPSEAQRGENETLHRVRLTQGFWLADTACTQALWQAVMGDNPNHFQGAEQPVERVSWQDVQVFLGRCNAIVPGQGFRLPTEAEWEYACRAGTTMPFWFGSQITPEQVNYDGNYPYAGGKKGLSRGETVAVKALPGNSWGLYQMHGNVWEWCQDWYAPYTAVTVEVAVVDPVGPARGSWRVLRGGSWIDFGRLARAARRFVYNPSFHNLYLGFRLARGQGVLQEAPQALVRRPAGWAKQP